MNPQRDVDLINELLAIGSETSWLEFKKDNVDPDSIGVRCSALANAARLAGKDRAYMLWGVEDQSLRVIGTVFNPDTQKAHGQELAFWLARQLQPSVAFEFRTVVHPDGQIRLLEIPAATSAPVAFKNIPYIRIGSATPKLTDYPERYQQLIEKLRPYTWEHALARQYATGDEVLELLDYSSYFKLTRQPLPDNRAGIFE
ncbi:AlbA family DNA-binding domain-containing protein, partial [Ectothiorhodospira lacustris]